MARLAWGVGIGVALVVVACSSDNAKKKPLGDAGTNADGSGEGGGAGGASGAAGTSGQGGADAAADGAGVLSCGTATCLPVQVGSIELSACCPAGAPNSCGLDVSAVATGWGLGSGCIETKQSGTDDPSCPDQSSPVDGGPASFTGCCRANGMCGVRVDLQSLASGLDFGCVDASGLLDGGTPVACGSDAGGDAEAGTDAGAPTMYWLPEDVHKPDVPSLNCAPDVIVSGFAIDPSNRPVLGWREVNPCSGETRAFWSRKETTGWVEHEVDPQRPDSSNQLAVNPTTGVPYMVFTGLGTYNYVTFYSDLSADPTGNNELNTGETLASPQSCAYTFYSLAFKPGTAGRPDWVTSNVNCNGYGTLALNGTVIGDSGNSAHAMVIGADGVHHVIANEHSLGMNYHRDQEAAVTFYTPGDFTGTSASFMRPGIAMDPGGVLHAVLPGYPPGNSLVYATSQDNGSSWSSFETIDDWSSNWNGILPVIAIDKSGDPAVVYWRGNGEMVYATRASGAWVKTVAMSAARNNSEEMTVGLAFDASNTPTIAYYAYDATLNGNPPEGILRVMRPGPTPETPVDLAVQVAQETADPIAAGQNVDYRVSVDNVALRSSMNDTIVVTLPANATLVSAEGSPAVNGNVLTYSVSVLNGGGRWVDAGSVEGVRITVQAPSSAGQMAVSATVTATELETNTSNNATAVTTMVQ